MTEDAKFLWMNVLDAKVAKQVLHMRSSIDGGLMASQLLFSLRSAKCIRTRYFRRMSLISSISITGKAVLDWRGINTSYMCYSTDSLWGCPADSNAKCGRRSWALYHRPSVFLSKTKKTYSLRLRTQL